MLALNIIIFILMGIALILGISLLVVFFTREKELKSRKKVNYFNYLEKRYLFDLKISKQVIKLTIIEIVLLNLLSVLLMFDYILIPYIFPVLIFTVIIVTCFINYCTSKRFNRNLEHFDKIHKIVSNNYSYKKTIEENINLIKQSEKDIHNKIVIYNHNLEKLIKNYRKIQTTTDVIQPLITLKESQIELYKAFDKEVTNIFDKVFMKYLLSKGKEIDEADEFSFNVNINIEPIIEDIYKDIENQFLDRIIEGYRLKKYLNFDALNDILTILIDGNLLKENEIDDLINDINTCPKNYYNIILLLFNNKLIKAKHIKNCIINDNEWILDNPIISVLHNDELVDIVCTIIEKNNLQYTNKFLIFTNSNIIDSLIKAINIANMSNESTVLISHYIKILDHEGAFSNLANRYESLALVIKQYCVMNCDNSADIDDIIRKESFYESRDYLDKTYYNIQTALEFIFSYSFKSMLYFSLYMGNIQDYFVQHKVNKLYIEYKKSLNLIGLLSLKALLDGLMLYYIDDAKVRDLICENFYFDELKITDQNRYLLKVIIPKYYPKTNTLVNNKKLYGRSLILNLFDNHKTSLYTIVNHIEKERLTIDKIKENIKKEE